MYIFWNYMYYMSHSQLILSKWYNYQRHMTPSYLYQELNNCISYDLDKNKQSLTLHKGHIYIWSNLRHYYSIEYNTFMTPLGSLNNVLELSTIIIINSISSHLISKILVLVKWNENEDGVDNLLKQSIYIIFSGTQFNLLIPNGASLAD